MSIPQTMSSHLTPAYLAEFDGQPLVVVAGVYIATNTIFVILRFVSRYLQRTSWSLDDFLVGLSWILNCAFFSTGIVLVVKYQAGHHTEYFAKRPDLLAGYGTVALYVQPVLYCIAVVPPRLAILTIYLKIFTSRAQRTICYAVGVLICAVAVGGAFTTIFMCNPREKAWLKTVPGGCLDIESLFIWGTFPNWVFDFVILILPIPVLWKLQIKLRVKVGLLATFMIGSLGMITALIRWSAYFTNRYIDGDGTWEVNPLEIYIMTEVSTYLICACLLSFRVLLHKLAHTKAAESINRRLMHSELYISITKWAGSSGDLRSPSKSDVMILNNLKRGRCNGASHPYSFELESLERNQTHFV